MAVTNEARHEKTVFFAYAKTKMQISCAQGSKNPGIKP